ncbi:ParB/RepB/Spo0J family partition protein [Sandaracinomonas limnophila]|uniref:ParB/RepB/Spo0J family partition protein n=1 Tax=Sandaracinomonas limnophila TaxID=1862386 RepID=A0A437PX73_9BACT|nr:ParB/RepB/Spo0J family partition protein [Sandaracinomonas limnophila]RVU26839.1 ParB/RepB/Spo0J family partition protein [Sandaracinomonas limnophila]
MSAKQEANSKKRIGLGRGLSALLEDSSSVLGSNLNNELGNGIESIGMMEEIPLNFIETNPYQPREHFEQEALQELAESIRVQGIIQPITVRKIAPKKFQLISGERRLQASKIAGLDKIPAYVRTADEQQMIEMALIENIQRENLNAMEIAQSYKLLMDECSLKQEELGQRVGKNRSTVTNYLRLLKLPIEIQISIRDGKLSMGHARCLVSLDDSELQMNLFERCIAEEWSVRKLEQAIREPNSPSILPKGGDFNANDVKKYQAAFAQFFHAKVSFKINEQGKGEIKIPFNSQDELNELLKSIQK